ncbi:unnamed protein product [Penicillium pancosmium]
MNGGVSSDGEFAMDATRGMDFKFYLVPNLSHTKLLDEDELKYYAEEMPKTGMALRVHKKDTPPPKNVG